MSSTLLITTFNRASQLNRSLERLTRLTIPDKILVVDDGSNDNTKETVDCFRSRLPIDYIYNHNPEWSICSYARNIGLKKIDTDIIITSEPEMLFVTDVIAQLLEKHSETKNKVISAGTIYHQGNLGTINEDTINNPKNILNKKTIVNNSDHNTIPNNLEGFAKVQGWVAPFIALYKTEWLIKINGWCEEYEKWGWEDSDLLTRLRLSGIGQNICLDIESIHQWHEKLPPHIQSQVNIANEQKMLKKHFYDEDINNPNIIANKNKDWGILKRK